MSNLPVEIITDILLRLPVKTLCVLKCVCRHWRTLISNPQFTKSFQIQSDRQNEILIRTDSLFTLTLDESPTLTKLPPLSNRDLNHFMDVVGSSNGLICLLQSPSTFFLLNPTTRESITIRPDPDYRVKLCGFGYVAVADDYKVVKVSSSSMVRVYSAKTNSWKRIQFDFPVSGNAYLDKKPVYVSGVIYWLISAPNTLLRCVIVGFDFIEENFKVIQLPIVKRRPNRANTNLLDVFVVNLGVLEGHLNVSFELYHECFELWCVLENGVRGTWNKMFTLPYYTAGGVALKGLLPVCNLRGQILIQVDYRYLFLFDPVNVKFQSLKLELPPGPCCKVRSLVYEEEEPCCAFGVIVYERSLVSPRGYFWLDESRVDNFGQ